MRFEVPQFIEIEDKIFGPLTWRQFVYVGGGAGLVAVLFFMTPFLIFLIVGVPIAVLAFLLGFFPVNNRPFSLFLEAVLRYIKNTKLYLWRKGGSRVYGATETESANPSVATFTPPAGKTNLNSLSRKLELKAIQKEK